jgi:hypothetical protein
MIKSLAVCPHWISVIFHSGTAAAWFAGIGTIVLAFVAVFQQWLHQLIVRPRLRMDARVARPDSEKTRWRNDTDVYYFRLAITNGGNAAAHDVQVYLAGVERLRLDNRYEAVERFSPMSLLWAHMGSPTRPVLLPKMPPLFCDLGHIADPAKRPINQENLDGVGSNETILGLELEVKPFSKGHLLEPGTYRFALKLAASNCKPLDFSLEVVVKGTWFDEEPKMFREGFGMRLL